VLRVLVVNQLTLKKLTEKERKRKLKKEGKMLKINDQYEAKYSVKTKKKRLLKYGSLYTDEIRGLERSIYVKHQKLQFAYKS
jgi:hypothetical protein